MITDERISTELTDDIDVVALGRVLWAHKTIVALFTVVAAVVAGVLAIKATPIYRAEVTTIAQANNEGLGQVGALTSQLSGLASLAGVNVGASQTPQDEALAVLKSNHLIEEFIQRNDLLPTLLGNSDQPRTLWRGVREFRNAIVTIREDARQGTITVAIDWRDPVVAARWANGFVALANELVRAHALEESTRNIAYLKNQATRTEDLDIRRVLFDLIENETRTVMLANGRTEYAFAVVDPAVAAEIPTGPHRALILLMGAATGFIVGAFIAFLRSKWHRPEGREPRRV